MQLIKQSTTAQSLVFFMYDSSNHVTGKTGLSPTVVIRKEGGSFASPAGSVTEIANGFYKVAGNATDTNTLGSLVLSATASGADQATMGYQVVAFDPLNSNNLGLGALPSASPGASGGLLIAGTNANFSTSGDFIVGGGLQVVGQLSADSFSIANAMTVVGGIAATLSTVTTLTNLPSIPVNWLTATGIANGAITSAKFAANALDAVWVTTARTITGGTITTYTGNTPQTGDSFTRIGATGSGLTSLAPSATALSTAIWTSGVAAHIDVDISSRLATSGYTPPANSTITTIAASCVKIQASTYDSTTPVSSSAVILSNGATYTVTSTGRTIS